MIEGEVKDVSYFDYNGGTNTKLLVEVKKSYSPNIKKGELLTFSEAGGITTEANIIRSNENKFNQPITEAMENNKVEVLHNGRPLSKVDEAYVYFGHKISLEVDHWDPIPGIDYRSIGGYQGQFKIKNGEAKRYDPDRQGDKYSLKMKKVDFDKELMKAIKNKH